MKIYPCSFVVDDEQKIHVIKNPIEASMLLIKMVLKKLKADGLVQY